MRNAAENVFMEVLFEFPSIERSGIAHSDEFYEILLEDSNLPETERIKALANVRQRTKKEVERLQCEYNELADKLAPYDDAETLKKALRKEQSGTFIYQIVWMTSVIFLVIAALIFLALMGMKMINTSTVWICLMCSLILSCILGRALIDKAAIYYNEEMFFLAELDEKRRELDRIHGDILNLIRLERFTKKAIESEK